MAASDAAALSATGSGGKKARLSSSSSSSAASTPLPASILVDVARMCRRGGAPEAVGQRHRVLRAGLEAIFLQLVDVALDVAEFERIDRRFRRRQQLELAIVENVQRKDLNPLERAKGYQRMMDEFSMTQDDVAKKVGQSRSGVANLLRLLTLPADMQAAIMDGKLTEGHAKVILGVSDPKERQQLFKKILSEGLSVRAVESERSVDVRGHKRMGLSAELQTKASRLGAALGTKVKISPKGQGGVLHVDYADAEELEGIVSKVEGR